MQYSYQSLAQVRIYEVTCIDKDITFVLGAQKNRFEYPQEMFWLRNKKHIFRYTLFN